MEIASTSWLCTFCGLMLGKHWLLWYMDYSKYVFVCYMVPLL